MWVYFLHYRYQFFVQTFIFMGYLILFLNSRYVFNARNREQIYLYYIDIIICKEKSPNHRTEAVRK